MKQVKVSYLIAFQITALVLLLSGCQLTNYSAGGKDAPITSVDVYQGTDGLEVEFLKDSPPEKVYEGESFIVSTSLKNKGAYQINRGKVILTHEPDYVSATTTSSTFNLKGKEMYDPSEHEVIKNFYMTAYKLEPKSFVHESVILVTACYDYGTKLSTEVCVDTDPQNLKVIEKACTAEEESFSGQGAPISITRVETKMLVGEGGKIRPQFWVYINNAESGQVISKNSIENACGASNINRDELNGVVLRDFRFSDYTFSDVDCKPTINNFGYPILKLVNNEQYFLCTLKEDKAISPDTPSFKTNLYVELEYAYTSTKSKTFIINKYNN